MATFQEEINDIRRRAGLAEQTQQYPYEWNEKTIVWDNGRYYLAVNDFNDPTYLTMWNENNQRIGAMATRPMNKRKEQWLGISNVEVQTKGQRLGTLMYQKLLDMMNPKWAGLVGYVPDMTNKKQIPSIYKRLGAEMPEDSDYWFIPNPNR